MVDKKESLTIRGRDRLSTVGAQLRAITSQPLFDKAANGKLGHRFTVSQGRAALHQRASPARLFTILSRATSYQPIGNRIITRVLYTTPGTSVACSPTSCCGAEGSLGISIHSVRHYSTLRYAVLRGRATTYAWIRPTRAPDNYTALYYVHRCDSHMTVPQATELPD
jgi:hypothetical protein